MYWFLSCVTSTLSDWWRSDRSTRCWRWSLFPQTSSNRSILGVIKKVCAPVCFTLCVCLMALHCLCLYSVNLLIWRLLDHAVWAALHTKPISLSWRTVGHELFSHMDVPLSLQQYCQEGCVSINVIYIFPNVDLEAGCYAGIAPIPRGTFSWKTPLVPFGSSWHGNNKLPNHCQIRVNLQKEPVCLFIVQLITSLICCLFIHTQTLCVHVRSSWARWLVDSFFLSRPWSKEAIRGWNNGWQGPHQEDEEESEERYKRGGKGNNHIFF